MSADERSKFQPLVAALTEAKLNETWHEKLGWSDEIWSRILILASKKEPGFAKFLSQIISIGLMKDSLPPPISNYLGLKFWFLGEKKVEEFFKLKGANKPKIDRRNEKQSIVDTVEYFIRLGFPQGPTKDGLSAVYKTAIEFPTKTPWGILKTYQRYEPPMQELRIKALELEISRLRIHNLFNNNQHDPD